MSDAKPCSIYASDISGDGGPCFACGWAKSSHMFYMNEVLEHIGYVSQDSSDHPELYEKLEKMGKFEELGQTVGQLVDSKQKQYGNSVGKSGKILEALFPNGIQPH